MQALASVVMASYKTYYEKEMNTLLSNSLDRVVVMCRLLNCKLQSGEDECLTLGHDLDLI